jgi:hypothetical protein
MAPGLSWPGRVPEFLNSFVFAKVISRKWPLQGHNPPKERSGSVWTLMFRKMSMQKTKRKKKSTTV